MGKMSKAVGGGVGAAAAVFVAWLIEVTLGTAMPSEAQQALGVLFAFGGAFIAPANST